MSEEAVRAFMEESKTDEAMQGKISSVIDGHAATIREANGKLVADMQAVAAEHGHSFSTDHIDAVGSGLSDADLDSIAGGSHPACTAGGGIQGAICAATGFITEGTTWIASAVTGGGISVASAVAK